MFFDSFEHELAKLASKTKTVEEIINRALRSRAGLGAGAGATIGGMSSDEGLLRGAARGAVVGGAAGWGLPKLLRARAMSRMEDPKIRSRMLRELRALGKKAK